MDGWMDEYKYAGLGLRGVGVLDHSQACVGMPDAIV